MVFRLCGEGMSELAQISSKERIAFYRKEIMRCSQFKGQHAALMLKIYRNLLSSALEGQQLEEREYY